jgi:hypothetical protein
MDRSERCTEINVNINGNIYNKCGLGWDGIAGGGRHISLDPDDHAALGADAGCGGVTA